jgi:cytochrome c553
MDDMGGGNMTGGAMNQTPRLAQSQCASCHGPRGISAVDAYPNLAGQDAMYLASSLRAYRDGTRDGGPMNGVASKLSDQQIMDLAMHFARLPAGR